MRATYAEIVESVKPLSMDEKRDLLELIKNYLIEERRQEILDNCIEARKEVNSGKLEYTDDADTFMAMLNNA